MSIDFSSKEVFAKRKAGALDEAYQMALKLNAESDPDEWDRKALAWCLISLIKRDFDVGNTQRLEQYRQQLEKMTFDVNDDEVLFSQRKYALSLVARVSESGGADALITNQKVFALRKAGKLDEAYQMALKLNARSDPDEWDIKALAWCLVDLIKREFSASNNQTLRQYRLQLEKIEVNSEIDAVLAGQREKALLLCDPSAPVVSQAQAHSKQQNYAQAVEYYNKIYPNILVAHHESFGWDLYRYSQQLYKEGPHKVPQIKQNFNRYAKLQVARPSILHSAFLRLATEMAKDNQLDLYVFFDLWGANNFRAEDFQRYSKDGKQYSALFEKTIQRLSKSTVHTKKADRMICILPFLDEAIERYEDNVWLVFYKAKFLLYLDRQDEAKKYCRTVCKTKLGAPWAWQLLGDAYHDDRQCSLSCYCKALLCPDQDEFTVNLRYKLALFMAELGHYAQAKFEINTYLSLKPDDGATRIRDLTSQAWFKDVSPTVSNIEFYQENKSIAEELLLSDLPWIDAVVGEKFTKPNKDGKARKTYRNIYIKAAPFALEQSCPERKFSFSEFKAGDSIKVKGENDPSEKYQIYSIMRRDDGCPWDVFLEWIGVVVFVNNDKHVYNIIIKRDVESFVHFDKVGPKLREGSFVTVRVSQHHGSQGKKYRIASAASTNIKPDSEIYKEFSDTVTIPDGMEIGFTSSENIFIPQHIVHAKHLADGDSISGNAVWSYNKKKEKWGWKALLAKKIHSANNIDYDNYEDEDYEDNSLA